MDHPSQTRPPVNLLHLPHAEKWEQLKPEITRLYINERKKLSEVMKEMRERHNFTALESEYKYRINRKWKLKRSLQGDKKVAASKLVGLRAKQGKSTEFRDSNEEVKKQTLRMVKSDIQGLLGPASEATLALRETDAYQGPTLVFGKRLFTEWNLPFRALLRSHAPFFDNPSPYQQLVTTPEGAISIVSTPAAGAGSPPVASAPSPLSEAISQKDKVERAYLFIQGDHSGLASKLSKHDRGTLATWLHQFWLYAFKTARHWGKGPRDWNAELLDLNKDFGHLSISNANTPGTSASSPFVLNSPPDGLGLSDNVRQISLCRWSVHATPYYYADFSVSDDEADSDAYRKWRDWPKHWLEPELYMEKLRNGLESNDFSTLDPDKLPVALPLLLRHCRRRHGDLLIDAFAFSIMGRNVDLAMTLSAKIDRLGVDVTDVYPFHLAAAYLDGSYPCCNILSALLYGPAKLSARELYVDSHGYTILDQLMISVLKSHSRCKPGDIDQERKREKRFMGEGFSICGRWDADSECIRELLGHGKPSIPNDWKHKFCHTSTQVTCHCISILFGSAPLKPDINAPFGLFLTRCMNVKCGRKLELLPLHVLTMVAYMLAEKGCEDEDLFEIIACLLGLLSRGADPTKEAEVSLSILFGKDVSDDCSHELMNPLQLASHIDTNCYMSWSPCTQTGWCIFCRLIDIAQRAAKSGLVLSAPPDIYRASTLLREFDGDVVMQESIVQENFGGLPPECHHCHRPNYFYGDPKLRDVWAAIQTELLTYRRINLDDPWTSNRLNMHSLLQDLETGNHIQVSLVRDGMMNEYCQCGNFYHAKDIECAHVDEACSCYFSNLEDWERTEYIYNPPKHWYDDDEEEEEEEKESGDEYADDNGDEEP